MNTLFLVLPPAINVLVTGVFAGVVLWQYSERHRIYQLYWSIALCMAFLATLAYIAMLFVQPTSTSGVIFFRSYYALGGAIMPSWLGLGSLALISSKRVTQVCFITLCALSLLAVVLVFGASVNMTQLGKVAGTPGTGILQPGLWLVATIVLNSLGVVAIAGVAIYSGWRLLRRQSEVGGNRTSNIVWANVLILVGALLNAVAGSLARFLGVQNTFWLIMSVGWIVLFAGVLLASRRSAGAKPVVVQHEQVKVPS